MKEQEPAVPYTTLDSEKIIKTIDRLSVRIGERFPRSGLHGVCGQLLDTAHQSQERITTIARPLIALRILVGLLIAIVLVGLIGALSLIRVNSTGVSLVDLVQAIEAVINDIVLVSAGLFFMITLENRVKRARALKALHELRSLAHVIDMHQLTKDPERVIFRGIATPSSPKHELTAFELSRYLDYCSEMLSLIGKLAALYAQHYGDSVVMTSVNEIESLTTGLARKIWQKLMILNSVIAEKTGRYAQR